MDDNLNSDTTLHGYVAGQKVFERFVLKELLGRGGMGVVWLARDQILQRDVALKFLPEGLAADPEAIVDLKRETKRALELTHPRIVRIFDFVEEDRRAAISMEYVPGKSLTLLKLDQPERCFEVAAIETWVAQLCDAVAYAHGEARIVHRDLKPANLMLDEQSNLKIADFGISATLTDTTTRISKTAGTSGTPVYMSPQQMLGKRPAATDDIYALGATVYELLTGKPPFHSGNIELQVMQVAAASLVERRLELEVGGETIPDSWENTIAACLAKEAADRPQSAHEVMARLRGHSGERAEKPMSDEGGNGRKEAQKPGVEGEATAKGQDGGASLDGARRPGVVEVGERVAPTGRRVPLLAGVFAATAVLGLAGWWLGVEQPRQQAVELERLRGEQAEQIRQEAAAQAEALRLATARGGLTVSTVPAGAQVSVGGVGAAASPATFDEMRLGEYEVTLTKTGYEDLVLTATVEENRYAELTEVALAPFTGTVHLESQPAGVAIALQSRRLLATDMPVVHREGRTPVTWHDLPIGNYDVVFQRDEWDPATRTLEVGTDQEQRVAASFASGELAVQSQPDGVEFEITGGPSDRIRRAGFTPATEELPVGDYRVVLRKSGWAEQAREVAVLPDQPASLAFDFRPATVELVSDPGNAQIFQQGKAIGRTPQILEDMPAGKHALSLRLDGHVERYLDVDLKAGSTRRLETQLYPLQPPSLDRPFENGLGMKFVPVPGTRVLFSVWETRVRDYRAFVEATERSWSMALEAAGDDHPAANIDWHDAGKFCEWLTQRERERGKLAANQRYRLPTDEEWSTAVGLPRERGTVPSEKHLKSPGFPWGDAWPAPAGVGNYSPRQGVDSFDRSSPAGSFRDNRFGLFDMGGNVSEWVQERRFGRGDLATTRGGSFGTFAVSGAPDLLQSSYRGRIQFLHDSPFIGFRPVIAAE